MTDVIVKIKVMPKNPEVDLGKIEEQIKQKITAFGGQVHKVEKEPIAFGLVALIIILFYDESKGDSEPLEKDIETMDNVQSVEVIDVRRAFG